MNSYNIFREDEPGTILFHAIAANEGQVERLAEENECDIEGLTIELERVNVRDQMGNPMNPAFLCALIK